MTRRILTTLALLLAVVVCAPAQQHDWLQQLEAHPEYLDGTDMLCPTGPVRLSPAPKGYKPFYLSHYGRHDGRYAWQQDLYDWLKDVFTAAKTAGNLTQSGEEFKRKYDLLYPEVRYRTGELSQVGWHHQQELAERMYRNFPGVFQDGARVTARSSTSVRCVMTMSSFCLGLKGLNPGLDIEEFFGKVYTPAIIPLSSDNPFKKEHTRAPLLFDETWEHYVEHTVDYRTILARLFKDVDQALPFDKQWNFTWYLYFLVNGMNSLGSDLDFSDVFTHEERIALWKADCVQFYMYIWPDHPAYRGLVDDLIEKADERIASGQKGADLRFGHDFTLTPLLMLLGVNGYDHKIASPEEIPVWCRVSDIPMGANLHLVFYKSKKDPKIIFKVLLNGQEARLPLETTSWPYYDWAAFKARYQ